MTENEFKPPAVWKWDKKNGGTFDNINRPIAGATHDADLPVGKHPFQLYSLATPNGIKVTVMFEELLALGISEAEYDAWPIRIRESEQFGSGFVKINPNSKIPALMDHSENPNVRIFESGAILLYLAEKFKQLSPFETFKHAECLSWLFWQMGSSPYLGGGFGHFFTYAPNKMEYPIDRFAMEVKRQLDVIDRQLSSRSFIIGNDYTIADIAIWAWYGQLALGRLYKAGEFLDVGSYKNVLRWAKEIDDRPAVKRGRLVNRLSGNPDLQLHERHNSTDFDQLPLNSFDNNPSLQSVKIKK